MGDLIPIRGTKRRKGKPRREDVPAVLGPTRLAALFHLWEAGYDKGYSCESSELLAMKDLRRHGYAECHPVDRHHWRITRDGMDRLLAPMRLLKEE